MNYKCILQYILLTVTISVSSQLCGQNKIDSVKNLIRSPLTSDSMRSTLASRLAAFYIGNEKDSANYYADIGIKSAELVGNERLRINAIQSKLDVNVSDWSLDTLREQHLEIVKISRKKGLLPEALSSLVSLGAAYSNRGLNEEGMKYNLQAIDIAEELGDKLEVGKLYYNIGAIYSNMGIYDKSNSSLKKAADLFHEIGNENFRVYSLSGIANNFNNDEEYDSAFHYSREIIRLADSLEYGKLQVSARATIGSIYLSQKDYERANEIFLEALPLAIKVNSTLALANCYCNLGRVNYFLENYNESLRYLEAAFSMDIAQNSHLINTYCLKEMALVQSRVGNSEKANKYFEEYVEFQDSILLKENKVIVTELEEKYENEKKVVELKAQEAEIAEKTYQRNMLYGGLGVSLLLGGSLVLGLLSRNKNNKRISRQEKNIQEQKILSLEREKQLLSMSSILEGQENERIRIAKDLHDGLGGLLTTAKVHIEKIRSQIEEVQNLDIYNKANDMIDKAHDEVRRISHNLMPGDLRAGGLPIAVRQLVHELKTVHEIKTEFEIIGFSESRIAEKVEFSVYRMIQELLNNLIKYASPNHVFVQLSKFESELQVVVEDDGIGFDLAKALDSGGLGLRSIMSRVEQLKGNIDIDSQPDKGVSVTINIPL